MKINQQKVYKFNTSEYYEETMHIVPILWRGSCRRVHNTESVDILSDLGALLFGLIYCLGLSYPPEFICLVSLIIIIIPCIHVMLLCKVFFLNEWSATFIYGKQVASQWIFEFKSIILDSSSLGTLVLYQNFCDLPFTLILNISSLCYNIPNKNVFVIAV